MTDALYEKSIDNSGGAFTRLTQGVAMVGIAGMLVIAILSTLDVVVLRAVFNSPIAGSNELLQTVFAVAISAVLASGQVQRSNLRVDALAGMFGEVLTRWLIAMGSILTLAFFAILAWRLFAQAATTVARHEHSIVLELPIGPFQYAIAVFMTLCVPAQLIVAVSDLRMARNGRNAAAEGGWLPATLIALFAAGLGTLVAWGLGNVLGGLGGSNPVLLGLLLFAAIWLLVLTMIPVGVAMAAVGLVGIAAILGWPSALKVLGSETAELFSSAELALIPLFLMMGSFAIVSGLSKDVFRFSQALFGPLRGGLAMAAIGGSAGFGALTGSSIATAVTIGQVGLPEMRKRGYDSGLAAGCVAAGATLGVLVPPSTIVVLYAVLTEQSIGQLYIAIMLPALISIVGYLLTIVALVRLRQELAPEPEPFNLTELLVSFRRSIAMFVLFGVVMAGIFFGVFTPTEAAAVGAVMSFLIALFRGSFNRSNVWSIAAETTRSVAMIYVLLIGALMAAYFFALTGIPQALTDIVAGSGLPPILIVLLICLAYLVFGTVMDSVTIMLITAALVAPIIEGLGYNPLWWGVVTVMVVELGVLTPPFGVNLFILKQLSPDTSIMRIYRGVMPFVFADVLKIALMIAVPALITVLPALAR